MSARKMAHTFWGQAWCANLERYRDFAYRLERGRTYARGGRVLDLRIEAGKVVAKVRGSMMYRVLVRIETIEAAAWSTLQRECARSIGSRLDLLQGKLSQPVMERLCEPRTGMFPAPDDIDFECSCPDIATMCKHVAATMYGVGARLDAEPELLFTLRAVSADELHSSALAELPAVPRSKRLLATGDLSALFGIEIVDVPVKKARKRAKPTP